MTYKIAANCRNACGGDFVFEKYIDRKIIESLVDRIEFGEINTETGRPMLKIFWAWD